MEENKKVNTDNLDINAETTLDAAENSEKLSEALRDEQLVIDIGNITASGDASEDVKEKTDEAVSLSEGDENPDLSPATEVPEVSGEESEKPKKKRRAKTEPDGSDGEKKPRRRKTKSVEESTEADTEEEKPKRRRKKKIDTDGVVSPLPDQITFSDIEIGASKAEEVLPEVEAVSEESDTVSDGEVSDAELVARIDALLRESEKSDDVEFDIPLGEASFTLPSDVMVDMLGEPIAEEPVEDEATEEPGEVKVYEPKPFSKREPKYDPENPRRVDFLFDFVELFIFTLVAVLIITTFFIRHSVVDGSSMENGLHDGDVLVISNIFYTPKRNDIVVVQDMTTVLDKPIVKRVIGIEGDVIRIAREGVYLNGEFLEEPYVFTDYLPYTYHTVPAEELMKCEGFSIKFEEQDGKRVLLYYEFIVPENELFVMGDHRNVSTDSRAIGTVRCDAVLGQVVLRLFPFEVFGFVE